MKGIAYSLEEEVEGENGQDSADYIISKYASHLWPAVLYCVQYSIQCAEYYMLITVCNHGSPQRGVSGHATPYSMVM